MTTTPVVTPEIALELNDLLGDVDLPPGVFQQLCDLAARLVHTAENRGYVAGAADFTTPAAAAEALTAREIGGIGDTGRQRVRERIQDSEGDVKADYLPVRPEVTCTIGVPGPDGPILIDLDAAGGVLGVERIGGPVDMDTLTAVLRALPFQTHGDDRA